MAGYNNRLYKSSLGDFDQLLVLAEGYLNKSFGKMYNDAKIQNPTSPLVSFVPGGFSAWTENCILDAPNISLNVEGTDLGSLVYTMKFLQGTLKVYTGDTPQSPQITCDMKGWTVPFNVGIGAAEVPQGSPDYNDLSKRFTDQYPDYFQNGKFSLYQIFLDATLAKATSMGAGSYPGTDWSKQPTLAFAHWQTMVQDFVNNAGLSNQNLLGLVASPNQNVGTPATFPPTWLQKQCYAWLDPNAGSSSQPKNGDPRNGLAYLMMAEQHNPPTDPLLLPSKGGCWISPDDGIVGSFSMSKDLFWNQYFLPILKPLNKGLQFYATKPDVKVWDVASPQWSIDFHFSVGDNPAGDDQFDFSWGDLDASSLDPSFRPSTPAQIHWGVAKISGSNADQAGSNPPNGVFRVESNDNTFNWTTINFTPGSNEIDVQGRGHLDARCDYKGTDTPAWPTWESFSMELTWSLKFFIANIEGGGVTIRLQPPPAGQDHFTTSKNEDSSTLNGTIIPAIFPGWYDKLLGFFQDYFKTQFQSVVSDINNALQSQSRLFLPGSGVLNFSDGTFNSEGDFISNVSFDGTSPN